MLIIMVHAIFVSLCNLQNVVCTLAGVQVRVWVLGKGSCYG